MLPRGRGPPRRLEPHRPEACDPLLEGWVCREEPHQRSAAERIHDEEVRGRRVGRHRRDLIGALELLEGANEVAPMAANPSTAHLFIVNPLRGAALMRLFSTHPPLEERIARLRTMRF